MANTTNRNTSPTCTKRSLNARLMSRLRIPSIPSSKMCPPSRMGIGSKFRIPRFTLISTISEMIASGPFLAACPAAREIPTGPCSCFSETRPLNNFPTMLAVSLIFSTVTRAAFPALVRRGLRRHDHVQQLALAVHIESHRLAVRSADALSELAPPLNLLPVHRRDQIILFEPRALCRQSRSHIFQNRPNRRKAQQLLRLLKTLLVDWNGERSQCVRVFHFHRELAVRCELGEDLLHLLPIRVFLPIDSNDLVARM